MQVIYNIVFPGLDGCQIARRVRTALELKNVPMVAVTGYHRDEDRNRALLAGFDYYLAKPFEPDVPRPRPTYLVK